MTQLITKLLASDHGKGDIGTGIAVFGLLLLAVLMAYAIAHAGAN